jgi:cysteine desulfurase
MISVSGHKIHAPKGVGALYVKQGTRLKSLHFGGGQEKGVRPGTENTAAITGFGLASELAVKAMEKNLTQTAAVKATLLNELSDLDGVYVNGDAVNSSPYILNLSFEDVKGEVLLHALENEEIYVATGSACSSKLKKKKKIVDLLIDGRGENNVRFSFSADNTIEEAIAVAAAVKRAVPMLRRFRPR